MTTAEATREVEERPAGRARAIGPAVLAELRERDDAGRPAAPFTDEEGGAPLRCCLRKSEPGEVIALVSYAPLRRWAAETGAEPGAYDEQGPVFVHGRECAGPQGAGPKGAGPKGAGLPFTNAHRVVRRYSAQGRILGGRLVEPGAAHLGAAIAQAFDDSDVALVHVRAVEYGCFLYEVRRP
ncbi:DUF1203 domain-containing protein [Streptomyces sp. NPDC006743]|uniref:DUF1203 domain-containing protein n=1 Tax=Streptomyces sp. NPDC006743 TaxID=3154480 RepID=UPI0034557E27